MSFLSVALCTYNGAPYLREQLESVATQTRRPDELVVRDDGSSDDTVAVLEAFAAESPFPVRRLPSGANLGYAKNFETTIAACSGDLIALSDQDDVWLPHKLERLERALGDDARALLAFSDATLVDGQLRPLGSTLWQSLRFGPALQERVREGGSRSPLLRNTFATGAACVFRASLLPIALPFALSYWHDAWLATLAAAVGYVVPVPEPLFLYRQHGRNAIGAPTSESRTVRQRIEALRRDSDSTRLIQEITGHSLELYSGVRARLVQAGQLDPAVGGALDRRIEHAQFRSTLPPMPGRLPIALRELAGGSYSRYSNGLRGFVRDLLR